MQYMGEIYSTDSDYGIEKLKNYKVKYSYPNHPIINVRTKPALT